MSHQTDAQGNTGDISDDNELPGLTDTFHTHTASFVNRMCNKLRKK